MTDWSERIRALVDRHSSAPPGHVLRDQILAEIREYAFELLTEALAERDRLRTELDASMAREVALVEARESDANRWAAERAQLRERVAETEKQVQESEVGQCKEESRVRQLERALERAKEYGLAQCRARAVQLEAEIAALRGTP